MTDLQHDVADADDRSLKVHPESIKLRQAVALWAVDLQLWQPELRELIQDPADLKGIMASRNYGRE